MKIAMRVSFRSVQSSATAVAKLSRRFAISEIEYEGCYYISFRMEKGTPDMLVSALSELAENIGDPLSLVGDTECPIFEKFDDMIPASLLRVSYAADKLELSVCARRIGEQARLQNKRR